MTKKTQRSSGILCHPTSFPGRFGVGSLGEEAKKFIDFLIESQQKIWQILPLGPTGFGDSPYQCFSAYAGNPILIDLDLLHSEGWLNENDLSVENQFHSKIVEFEKVYQFKKPILKKAYTNFKEKANSLEISKFDVFCRNNKQWLNDFALFASLKNHFEGKAWTEWEKDLVKRKPETLDKYKNELSEAIDFQKYMQYIFFKQWAEVKAYANQNGIEILGDVPIYISFDSADAWTNPEYFLFDENMKPTHVAGVPPDYFSADGQLWGNPIYNWNEIEKEGFKWWIERIKANLTLFDILRIDHFRGFEAFWSVPADEKTARNGKWVKAPGIALFQAIREALGEIPIIAEDLGVITPEVEKLRDMFGFPGMKILQFAFNGDAENEYLPHNYTRNSIVYTGTHDNDTTRGWYDKITDEYVKRQIHEYMNCDGKNISWDLIRLAWAAASKTAIAPMQDLLELGNEARMNMPGSAVANWSWRFEHGALDNLLKENKLRKITQIFAR